MSATTRIRLADAGDAAPIQAIYAPYVRETPVSFEVEPPTVEEMRGRIETTLPRFPWLVCEHAGEVVGYAYATTHRARAAYQWSVEVAVYVGAGCHRSGVGTGLYGSLLAILRLQGFHSAYAGITLPNPGSVGLHEAVGFRPLGVFLSVGYKQGRWHDVGWWQLNLREDTGEPTPPLTLEEAKSHPEWQTCLDTGLPCLRL